MGRRGPPKTPAAIAERNGNPGHRKKAKRPTSAGAAPACPQWLIGEARKEWNRLTPLLGKMGLIDKVDQVTLAAYCQAAAELIDATRMLNKKGRIYIRPIFSRSGEHVGDVEIAHPAVKLQRDAFARLKQFLGEFGLSPASRAGLDLTSEDEAEDPLDEIILKLNAG